MQNLLPHDIPRRAMTQMETAAEQVEHGHTARGEPTYAELQAINADLLTALEQMQERNGCFDGCRGPADRNHGRACLDARAAIAKAKGETP